VLSLNYLFHVYVHIFQIETGRSSPAGVSSYVTMDLMIDYINFVSLNGSQNFPLNWSIVSVCVIIFTNNQNLSSKKKTWCYFTHIVICIFHPYVMCVKQNYNITRYSIIVHVASTLNYNMKTLKKNKWVASNFMNLTDSCLSQHLDKFQIKMTSSWLCNIIWISYLSTSDSKSSVKKAGRDLYWSYKVKSWGICTTNFQLFFLFNRHIFQVIFLFNIFFIMQVNCSVLISLGVTIRFKPHKISPQHHIMAFILHFTSFDKAWTVFRWHCNII
jgi:hypothetical protein